MAVRWEGVTDGAEGLKDHNDPNDHKYPKGPKWAKRREAPEKPDRRVSQCQIEVRLRSNTPQVNRMKAGRGERKGGSENEARG